MNGSKQSGNEKTVFDVDGDKRACDSAHVRVLCGSPSDPTWRSYRRLIGVASKAKKLTLRHAYLLWVTANLYANGERKLTRAYVYGVASALLNQEPQIEGVFRRLVGEEGVEGRNLPEAIASLSEGEVSLSTLYRIGRRRNMPTFGLDKKFTPIQIRRFANAVKRKRRKATA